MDEEAKMNEAVEPMDVEEEVLGEPKDGRIDPKLLESLELLQKGFNLASINEVIASLLVVADVLINNPELADVVLLKAKDMDGTLTDEELIEFANGMENKTLNSIDKGEDIRGMIGGVSEESGRAVSGMDGVDSQIMQVIEHFIPGASGYIPELLEKFNGSEENKNLTAFMDELKNIMAKASSSVSNDIDNNKITEVEEKKEGILEEEEDKGGDRDLATIKVISLNGNKNNGKNNAPMGADNWLKYARQRIG